MSKYQNEANNHIEKRMPWVKAESYFDSIEELKKKDISADCSFC